MSDVMAADLSSNSQPQAHESEYLQRLRIKSEAYHSAKLEFFKNLDNYIPLGSATVVPDESEGLILPEDWDRSGTSPKLVPKSLPIYGLLEGLQWQNIIRVFIRKHQRFDQAVTVRVYVLPDDVGRRFWDREGLAYHNCLRELTSLLDLSLKSWEGRNDSTEHIHIHEEAQERPDPDSLFYIFNTLPSPSPRIEDVSCSNAKAAMGLLLHLQIMPGLKTELYPYQKRSAAEMIRRETAPSRKSDPRFQVIEGPTGRLFYYDSVTGRLRRDQQEYEEARGGILAEVGDNQTWGRYQS